jgi:5-methyltetrahydropteroyltriglutamate--homocysteine methyltransferase
MKRSTERILTTHVGSLPRLPDLLEMIEAKEQGRPVDLDAYARRVARAVAEAVEKQAACGIDIVADGEMGRFGFIPYVNERLAGLEPRQGGDGRSSWSGSREHLAFPEYYRWAAQMPGAAGRAPPTQWVCTGPVSYRGHDALRRDIDNLKAALAGVACEEAFMPAVSPANLANWNSNEHYPTDEEFRVALADALHEEYRAIVAAGLVLQIDDPQLASHWAMHPEIDLAQCRKWAAASVELLNHALRGIPADRVRYHTCYSINMGPRVHDLELKHVIDIMLGVRAGAYSFEAANPRHEHEWRVWETVKLPDGKVLIPGIITHASNLVEHPEAVAQRIARFAGVVGRDNVIAGADCGFASFSTSCEVHPSVVWTKLAALAEGARLATTELWGKARPVGSAA